MICPFCLKQNAPKALVCEFCSHDIAVPDSLVAERDELIGKRDVLRRELETGRAEIQRLIHLKKYRPT